VAAEYVQGSAGFGLGLAGWGNRLVPGAAASVARAGVSFVGARSGAARRGSGAARAGRGKIGFAQKRGCLLLGLRPAARLAGRSEAAAHRRTGGGERRAWKGWRGRHQKRQRVAGATG
jgi:hypothetical protein